MVNAERAAHGAEPVILNYDLCVAAVYRCLEMERMGAEHGAFYSGPDANGEMLWNTVSRVLTGDTSYVGTENKSLMTVTGGWGYVDPMEDFVSLLRGQFGSEAHYAQIIGPEYGQIGIGFFYTDGNGSYRIAEEIRVGE